MAPTRTANVAIIAMSFNIALTFALFTAAAWSGSSAVLATAIQSLIAASSQALVLYGLSRAARATPAVSPNEVAFWSFGVAVLLFSLGAGISIYDGVMKLADPLPNKYVHIAYAALAATFIALAVTARLALSQLSLAGPHTNGAAARASQEPAASTIAIESLAGLLGVLVAAAGIAIADLLSVPVADGYAAIMIGLLLGVVAVFMSLEIRNLLIGSAAPDVRLGLHAADPSPFFIEDEAAAPARAMASVPSPAAASVTGQPLSRKERKRHKGKH